MGIEVKPNSLVERSKFFNRLDEAFGMLCLIISRELLFHVDSLLPQMKYGYGSKISMGILMRLGVNISKMISSPNSSHWCFNSSSVAYRRRKRNSYCPFFRRSLFVSTFHSSQLIARIWKMPSLDSFVESLTQEQDKLV